MTTINAINTPFSGPTVDGANGQPIITNGSGILSVGTISAAGLVALGNSGVSFISSTTFDLSTSSGDTAIISGIGFTPSVCIVFSAVSSSGVASWGFDRGGAICACTFWNSGIFGINSSNSVIAVTSVGNQQTGNVTFSSGSATWTFTKTGSPTGTLTIIALFFK